MAALQHIHLTSCPSTRIRSLSSRPHALPRSTLLQNSSPVTRRTSPTPLPERDPGFPEPTLARRRFLARAQTPGDDAKGESPPAAAQDEKKDNAAVTAASDFLGKVVGTPLWFAILLITLLGTFGGYGYLIVSNVELSNVPIVVGSKYQQEQRALERLQQQEQQQQRLQ